VLPVEGVYYPVTRRFNAYSNFMVWRKK